MLFETITIQCIKFYLDVQEKLQKRLWRPVFGLLILLATLAPVKNVQAQAEDSLSTRPLRVFLDCNDCDAVYIRRQIPYVDYVRDRQVAQVHVYVTEQGTASGGRSYRFRFIGQENFEGNTNDIIYTSPQSDSEQQQRQGLTQTLQMGLMPYVAQTPQQRQIDIIYESDSELTEAPTRDPWNFWVFRLAAGGRLQAESSQNQVSFSGGFRADRITEKWKFRSEVEYDYERENVEDDGETISSSLNQRQAQLELIRSLGPHWSVGWFGEVGSTTFRNLDLSLSLAPAVEYNVFPWSESDHKILTAAYRVGLNSFRYREETLYDKTAETLAFEALRLQLSLIQPWGEVDISLEGLHFFHDWSKYRLEMENRFEVRLSRGLSVFLDVEIYSIHDQLYLPKGEASLDEVLLKRRQLATTFDVDVRVSLRYTFGSIFNNVINQRL